LLNPMVAGAGPGKFLLPLPGPIAREGSLEECVYRQLKEGASITQAIDACVVKVNRAAKSDLLDTGTFIGAPGHNATGLSMVGCPSSGADPTRAEGLTEPDRRTQFFNDRQLNMWWLQIELWKHMRQAAVNEALGARTKDEKEAAWGVVNTINNEINRQVAEMGPWLEAARWKQAKDKEPAPPAGDFPPPDPETAPARGVQGYESPCTQTLLFIGECNRDGWRSPNCKTLLDRMNKCLDRTVADPANPEDTTCGVPAVDAQKVQDVVMLLCSSKKRFGPDDNPCDTHRLVQGTARIYWRDRGKVDECNDPRILRSEPCAADITVVEFGAPDLEKIQKFGADKLGGPILIFPIGTPRDTTDPTPKPPPFK